MARARFRILAMAACVLTLTILQFAWGEEPAAEESTCKVYSLANLGNDPELGHWIAKTIPQVIEPDSWQKVENTSGAATPAYLNRFSPAQDRVAAESTIGRVRPVYHRTLSYYAPAKILVVSHTPKVHEEVAAFLKGVQKALPPSSDGAKGAATPATPALPAAPASPASYSPPQAIPPSLRPAAHDSTKPDRPRHLFHIIIDGLESGEKESKLKNFTLRYEGEGIIDSNVAKLIKSMYRQGATAAEYVPTPLMPSAGYDAPLPSVLPGAPSGSSNVFPAPVPSSTQTRAPSFPAPVPSSTQPSSANNTPPTAQPSAPSGETKDSAPGAAKAANKKPAQ